MMPFCEYRKCKKVAAKTSRLLRKWGDYDNKDGRNRHQEVWLCDKHLKKVNKILLIEEQVQAMTPLSHGEANV